MPEWFEDEEEGVAEEVVESALETLSLSGEEPVVIGRVKAGS